MFRISLERTSPNCAGVNRRSFLQMGLAGMGGLSLAEVLRLKSGADESKRRDTSLILIWLDGGPSHIDTYDPKPEAPAEYRGLWNHVATEVPGMRLSETCPLQSSVASKYSLVRSVHHVSSDHFEAAHLMLTGRKGVNGANTAQRSPFLGSIAARVVGPRRPGMPPLVGIPYAMSVGLRPGYFGANYVGTEHNPFETDGDPNQPNFQVRNLNLAKGLSIDRLEDRRAVSEKLDGLRRRQHELPNAALDSFDQQAFDLVTGDGARKAFRIDDEPAPLRERYGRNPWGQSVLLARRLVEAGATVVTCHFGGWDSHWDHRKVMDNHMPRLDRAVHGLLTDLSERSLLERVMVVVCGEFGRTPRMNDGGNGGAPMSKGTPGRDHWGGAFSVLMAGGGLRGGQVIGGTNRLGEFPIDRPLRVGDVHATIFHQLGIDPGITFPDHSGRPIHAIDQGEPIRELI